MKQCVAYQSRFGTGWVVFDGEDLVEVTLPGASRPDVAVTDVVPAPVGGVVDQLTAFWEGTTYPAWEMLAGRLAVTAGRTEFLRAVYERVARIPPGDTMTYGEVAEAVGRPGAARAVGSAMAHNPFPPIIPCHRVVASGGGLGGYAGGLDMKAALLEEERDG